MIIALIMIVLSVIVATSITGIVYYVVNMKMAEKVMEEHCKRKWKARAIRYRKDN